MLKIILLGGLILASGAIGTMGVLRVTARRDALKRLLGDIKLLEHALTMQGMTLYEALNDLAQNGQDFYHDLAEHLRQTTEQPFGDSQMPTDEALRERDKAIFADFLRRLAESVSAAEITLATARCGEELGRVLAELEETELKRARVLRKVWLLAGIGLAVILI